MKKSITLWAVIGITAALAYLVGGCTIEREVDFMAGIPSSQPPVYFGTAAYVPDIETFMQIGSYGDPGVSADGRRVFFTSSATGVNQLYRLTEDGWPYQLTVLPDGIDWHVLSHSADMAVIGASIGGSEQSQLLLIDTRTGRLRNLTDQPNAMYGSVLWDPNDQTIFFRSNMENLKDFKLYRMDITSGTITRLVDAAGWNGWVDIALDGARLVYLRATSSANTDLYLYDLATADTTCLTPHTGDIRYENALFSADGSRLYLLCNDNSQGLMLRATIEIESRKLKFMESGGPWDVDALALSPRRDVMAWVINQDGYGRLKLAEVAGNRELPAPSLNGLVTSPLLSESTRLVFAFNSPNQAPDIWSWDWRAKELVQLTFARYAGIDRGLFVEPKLVTYNSFDGIQIPAFLYLPADYSGQPIPMIVDMHGGPASQERPSFNRHFQYLLLHGYGLFAPNVRGSDGYGKEFLAMDDYKLRLNSVKDMKAGVDWLVQNKYTKPGMIGVKGGSYGGYMVAAAITEYPELFAAAWDEYGIVNYVSYLENTSAYRRALREAEYGPLADREFLHSISPLHKADRIQTPLMVVHGINDPRVPVGEARQIIKAITDRQGTVDSLIFPDEGHGIGKLANRLVVYRAMVDFFDKYLKNPDTIKTE